MKRYHKLNYKITKIEKHLDKMMKQSKRKVKCCLKHWVCWWEKIKEVIMPGHTKAFKKKKPMASKRGGRRGGKKRRG